MKLLEKSGISEMFAEIWSNREDNAMAPRVSIGLPVYNGERYLEKALGSLLNQDFEDFELILSDNASTDRTAEICKDYAARDRRIVYHRNERNMGATRNYNLVLQMASGYYFKWAAHDDMYAPTYLSRCVEVLDEAPPSVALCYPRTILIDEYDAKLDLYDDRMEIRLARPHHRLRHVLQNLRMCNAVFGVTRTSTMRATRLLGNYVSADMVLLAELALQGEFWQVPDPLFFRRRHPNSSCEANRTPEEVAAWFDPRNHGRAVARMTRLFWEHLKGIRSAPIGRIDRYRCYWVAMSHWLPRWRAMGGEVKRAVKLRLGRL